MSLLGEVSLFVFLKLDFLTGEFNQELHCFAQGLEIQGDSKAGAGAYMEEWGGLQT